MDNYDYGLVGNGSTAALISADSSIDWLCIPYFDSSSLFGKLIDEEKGGFFKIEGVQSTSISQRYIRNTAILKTTIETADGVLAIYDYMPRYFLRQTEYYTPSEIHRNIVVESGAPKIRVLLEPRPNYALGGAHYVKNPDYIKIISQEGEYNTFYLYTNLDFDSVISGDVITLPEHSYFVLSYHEKLDEIDGDKIFVEYEKTKSYWLDWSQKTKAPKMYRDLINRSAITLKLMVFEKTGAVIAAPTTSLPEIIGRDRNWDYRYCWVRDASMIVDMYLRIGHVRKGSRFINFMINRMLLKGDDIKVMYGIHGEEDLVESELDHLAGYKNSKPVRIGNGAYIQQQNDLYGELIEAIYTFFVVNKRGADQFNEEVWTAVRTLVNQVKKIWHTKDSGIWERRGHIQHYLHSKLMNWVAMDRAVKIAKWVGKEKYIQPWQELADIIKEDILAQGWNEEAQAFTMYYGSTILDASSLLMLHYGFLPNNDPRIVSTVKKSYEILVKDGYCFRYIDEDEFGAPENAFIVCTFWMINALYLIGEEKTAREMLKGILARANHLGLLAEDVEIKTGRLIGNFPQGYSHLALIQTLLLLETDYNWSDASTSFNFK